MTLFATPQLDLEDSVVLEEIHDAREELASRLRIPRNWTGSLRRNAVARAIRGSNSIEGYHVDLDDAVAAVEDESPMSADAATWLEIRGYRLALGYVLAAASDPATRMDESMLKSLHYMMLSHEGSKSPGRYREREIFVQDEKSGAIVYIAPDADRLGSLVRELVHSLQDDIDPFIGAAMSHLNLVMIHPFRDGNGRMARCLQTFMLGCGGVAEPAFSSIEEWLGRNTEDYYSALAITGHGFWQPHRDAGTWLKFCLRAHHMQMQTVQQRFQLAALLGAEVTEIISAHKLPERTFDVLYEALLGLKVRRLRYVESAQIEERTATRDLTTLVKAGLLIAHSQTRGRYYTSGESIRARANDARRGLKRIRDPYPGFIQSVRRQAEELSEATC